METKISLNVSDMMASVLDRLLVYEIQDQATWNAEENGINADTRAAIIKECYTLLEQLEAQTNAKRHFICEYKERV